MPPSGLCDSKNPPLFDLLLGPLKTNSRLADCTQALECQLHADNMVSRH